MKVLKLISVGEDYDTDLSALDRNSSHFTNTCARQENKEDALEPVYLLSELPKVSFMKE